MNIVIPLGGVGSRFTNAGYLKPKPLIKVLGKEILFWLIDSLNLKEEDNLYIPYNEYLDNHHFKEIVLSKYPNINLKSIPPTNGAASTIKKAIEEFDITGKIVLLDGDTWYGEDILSIVRKYDSNVLTYFTSTHIDPVFSYVELDKGSRIVDIREKQKISNNANTGCYVFQDADELYYYIKITEVGHREVYISDVINSYVKDNNIFNAHLVKDFHVLGTPQQVIQFSKSYDVEPKRFVFDLDNTLVSYPTIPGDYNSCKPIEKTISYLRNLKSKGHHIIIYTARRMRTHSGNVGALIADIGGITMDTLKRFNIPYDELYFGKPYGHYYIDDLMINPKSDLNKELGYYMENVEPRHFNELTFKDDKVIKTSTDTKLQGESFYYNEIQKYEVGKYYPKLIESTEGRIVMERIDGLNFSTLYVNEILSEDHISKLVNTIDEVHSQVEGKYTTTYFDYTKKVEVRLRQIDVNPDYKWEVLSRVKDYGYFPVIIHGDLVFSNVMLTSKGDIKLIDVKGKIGKDLTIMGDKWYDYAKIYQSLIGYDSILLDKPVSESYKRNMLSHFESFFIKDELQRIKNITKSLLVSLIPLHKDKVKQQKYLELSYEL